MASPPMDGPPPRVVVGVDGSESSRAALRWAARRARLTGGVLEAVVAWDYPALYVVPESLDEFEDGARTVLARTVEEALGPRPEVEVRRIHRRGGAPQVLVEASRGAELLVVGSRGLGAVTGTLLGSVSRYCVRHAACPVVVVRGGGG